MLGSSGQLGPPTGGPARSYKLASVTRAPTVAKVAAYGTVQPRTSVVVGSQVSGQVKEVLVDNNDHVARGQPIARIDPQIFLTRVAQAKADVDVAENSLRIVQDSVATAEAAVSQALAERARAAADLDRARVLAGNAHRRFDRKSALMRSGATSASDAEDAQSALDVAMADATAARAMVESRDARIAQARSELEVARSRVPHAGSQLRRNQAALDQARADLDQTEIRAPADGLVIERSVSPGQTVAASFQAPSLFTIGELRAISVEVAVDEADIGRIQSGQRASFSVDAYPGRTFPGSITQVRRSPHTEGTVVTYTAVLSAENPNFLLFPGMTAKAEIATDEKPVGLHVPTAALRYAPSEARPTSVSRVWVLDGSELRPVPVRVGTSDSDTTEVSGALRQGDRVVLAEALPERPQPAWTTAARLLGGLLAQWIEPAQAALAAAVAPQGSDR